MDNVLFSDKGWGSFVRLIANNDMKMFNRVNKIIEDIKRNGYRGIGNPEPLSGNLSGYWSRRIDKSNRIVYKVEGEIVKIIQCGTHYGDK